MLNMFLYINVRTSSSMCAVPNMAVFRSSLISCFTSILLRNFLSDFEMVPFAHIITGITFVFKFHMPWLYYYYYYYYFYYYYSSQGGVVRIATRRQAGRSGVQILAVTLEFSSKMTRMALRPAQPPIQNVQKLFAGYKAIGRSI